MYVEYVCWVCLDCMREHEMVCARVIIKSTETRHMLVML